MGGLVEQVSGLQVEGTIESFEADDIDCAFCSLVGAAMKSNERTTGSAEDRFLPPVAESPAVLRIEDAEQIEGTEAPGYWLGCHGHHGTQSGRWWRR